MKKMHLLILFVIFGVFATACAQDESESSSISESSPHVTELALYSQVPQVKIVYEKTIINSEGKAFTVVSCLGDREGEKYELFFDSEGRRVKESDIGPLRPPSPFGGELADKINNAKGDAGEEVLDLVVSFNDFVPEPAGLPDVMGQSGKDGGQEVYINGKLATQKEIEDLEKKREEIHQEHNRLRKKRRQTLIGILLEREKELGLSEEDKNDYIDNGYGLDLSMQLNKIKGFYDKNSDIISHISIKAIPIDE